MKSEFYRQIGFILINKPQGLCLFEVDWRPYGGF